MRSRRGNLGLVALLVFFGSIYLSTLDSHGMLMWDEAHYATLGRAILHGEGYVNVHGEPEKLRPPLVPLAAATAMLIGGDESDATLKLAILFFSVLCIAVVYAIARTECGVPAGLLAAVTLATFPEFWRSTSYLLTENPFMALHTAAVAAFALGLGGRHRWFLVAWPCFALALLTRYTAALFVPTILLLIVLEWRRRENGLRAALSSVEFVGGPLIALAIVGPWLLRAWILFGDPLAGLRVASAQVPAYGRHGQMPVGYYLQALPEMLGWIPTLCLAAASLYVVLARRRLGLACLVGASVIFAWMTQYQWKEPRLVSGALPFFAVLIGLGAEAFLGAFGASNPHPAADERRASFPTVRVGAHLALALSALAAFASSYRQTAPFFAQSHTLGYPSFLQAMRHLGAETAADATVLGPNCHQISWYARRRCRGIPSRSKLDRSGRNFTDVLAEADWLVLTNFERGQPDYVRHELAKLRPEDFASGRVRRFRDERFWTVLVPTRLMIERSGESSSRPR